MFRKSKYITTAVVLLAATIGSFQSAQAENANGRNGTAMVNTVPSCPGDAVSTVFKVAVNGQPVPVAFASFNGKKSFHMASFEISGPVDVAIHSGSRDAPQIRPISAGLSCRKSDSAWTFRLESPRPLAVQVPGQEPLLLFALPPEKDVPSKTDEDLLFFGPGAHNVDELRLKSNQTVYLAPGAVVKGRIYGFEVENVRICGRGVIDARGYTSKEKKIHGILFERSKNIEISGIQLRTGDWWQCMFLLSDNIRVQWIQTLSFGANNDGVDIDGVTNLRVEDCFIGCGDDGFGWHALDAVSFGEPPTSNCIAERCVIWNEYAGNGLRIGASMETRLFENIAFRNIDVVNVCRGGVAIMSDHSDWATVQNVLFEDFRNETGNGLMKMVIGKTRYSNNTGYKDERGVIQDVYFNRVASESSTIILGGAGPKNMVKDFWFANCTLGGKPLKDASGFKVNQYVKDLKFVDKLPERKVTEVVNTTGRKLEQVVIAVGGDGFHAFGGNETKILKASSKDEVDGLYFTKLGWGRAATYRPALEGNYKIEVKWGKRGGVATKAPWTVKHSSGYKTEVFDQNATPEWNLLGTFQLNAQSWVKLVDPHYRISNGPVIAGSVRFTRVAEDPSSSP